MFGHDARVAEWVAQRIPHVREFGECAAIGVLGGSRLLAGVVFHLYDPSAQNIQISMAAESPMWARRETITALLRYPFRQLGCWMIYTLIPPENVQAIRVNEHIGLKRKTILPHTFGRKRHAVVCQMVESEFRRLYDSPGTVAP